MVSFAGLRASSSKNWASIMSPSTWTPWPTKKTISVERSAKYWLRKPEQRPFRKSMSVGPMSVDARTCLMHSRMARCSRSYTTPRSLRKTWVHSTPTAYFPAGYMHANACGNPKSESRDRSPHNLHGLGLHGTHSIVSADTEGLSLQHTRNGCIGRVKGRVQKKWRTCTRTACSLANTRWTGAIYRSLDQTCTTSPILTRILPRCAETSYHRPCRSTCRPD